MLFSGLFHLLHPISFVHGCRGSRCISWGDLSHQFGPRTALIGVAAIPAVQELIKLHADGVEDCAISLNGDMGRSLEAQ